MGSVFKMEGVSFSYSRFPFLEDINLSLDRGQSLALLGINGAGKTSMIRLLLGMLKPKSGSINVLDHRAGYVPAFAKIGYAPEEATPPDFLSAVEYLRFVEGMRGRQGEKSLEKVLEYLDFFEIEPVKKVRDYSKGMRRRLVLAQAFIGNPDWLILDEPFNGLDPLLLKKLREKVIKYCESGGSVLICSHILSEIEKIAGTIAILHKGKLLHCSPTQSLLNQYKDVEEAFTTILGNA